MIEIERGGTGRKNWYIQLSKKIYLYFIFE